MNYRNMLKVGIVLLCGFGLLCGCKEEGKLWSSDESFPEREIVFEMSSGEFGFVEPDGSGLITQMLVPEDLGACCPTWSPDGKYIAFRAENPKGGGYFDPRRPRVVSSKGETAGWCEKWLWGNGRIWVTPEDQLLLPLRLPEEPDRIVLADFGACKEIATLFEVSSVDSPYCLDSASLSSQNWLAVSRVLMEDGVRVTADILVIEPGPREERVIGHGLAPAWSKDGEWLAYTQMDGIYVVRKDGTQTRKVVDVDSRAESYPHTSGVDWYVGLPAPSWSPDGKWLVYHRMTQDGPTIYKVNVESGVEVEIFRGGVYPDWRWDLGSTSE